MAVADVIDFFKDFASVLQDESQSDEGGSDYKGAVQQLLEQLLVEKWMKSGLELEDISNLNEIYELLIAMEEERDLTNFEELQTETPLFGEREESSIDEWMLAMHLISQRNLMDGKLHFDSPFLNNACQDESQLDKEGQGFQQLMMEIVKERVELGELPTDGKDKDMLHWLRELRDHKLPTDWEEEQDIIKLLMILRELQDRKLPTDWEEERDIIKLLKRLREIQDLNLPTDWEKEQDIIKLLKRLREIQDLNLPTDWEKEQDIIKLLKRLREIQDRKLPTDWEEERDIIKLSQRLQGQLKARVQALSNGKEVEETKSEKARDVMRLFCQLKETGKIEKLPEHMVVDHEIAKKLMQYCSQYMDKGHMGYKYSLNKKFLYQKVMELSKTDDVGLEIVELLPKQPHELIKHSPTIRLMARNIRMLTDGHQDSERVVHLFNVLISLAPAIILPQQSEIILSYVKMNDILLSLLNQFPEVCVQYTWDMM